MHQALADHALVAKHPEEPRLLHQRVGEFAVVEQAGVRLRRVRHPLHQRRQQHRLDPRFAGASRRQRREVVVRPIRIEIAECRQLALGGVGRQLHRADVLLYDGVKQRAEEQLVVQRPDLPARGTHPLRQRVGGAFGTGRDHARGPAQPTAGGEVLLRRQGMGAAHLLQLQAVLQQAHEFVALDEHPAVLAADVPGLHQGVQRLDGRQDAQRFVVAAVDQLQQLHRELHVAQAAAAELELAQLQLVGDVLDDAVAHRLDVLHEGIALGGRPHQRRQGLDVLAAKVQVAGHGPGLELRLELPRLRPPLVVRLVRLQRAHQRTGLALRPQGRVDLEEAAAGHADELRGQPGGAGIGGLGDEDDVDVGDVVELAGAALAHGQHGQARRHRRIRVGGGHGHRQGGGQRGVGQVRQGLGDLGERDRRLARAARTARVRARQVGCGHAHDQVAVRTLHGDVGVAPGDPGAVQPCLLQVRRRRRRLPVLQLGGFGDRNIVGAHRRLRDRFHGGEHVAEHVRAGRQVGEQQRPRRGIGHHVIAEHRRAAEQREHAGAHEHLLAHRRIQRRPRRPLRHLAGFDARVQALLQPHQGLQRQLRIGGAGEPPQQLQAVLVVPAELL